MKSEINLLIDKKKEASSSLEKKLAIIRIVSVSFLFLVSVSAIILFILIIFSPLPALRKIENTAVFQLNQLHPKIASLIVTEERITSIENILQKRMYQDQEISVIEKQAPSGLAISSLKIDKNTISVNVSSNSLLALDTFINKIQTAMSSQKHLQNISLNELSMDDVSGKYSCIIDISL